MSRLRVAMISEHASPLADLGGTDAGGQNVHVAQLARALAERGHEVRVYTRRDGTHPEEVVHTTEGYAVEHVPAGPAVALPKDAMFEFMGQFGDRIAQRWRTGSFQPDVVHAHFWMSGMAALQAQGVVDFPLVITYHALGTVKQRMQGDQDTSPPGRIQWERKVGQAAERVVAQCSDEVQELHAYEIADDRITVVTSGVDTELFRPPPRPRPRASRVGSRLLSVGRLVPRKGFADLVRVLPRLAGTELIIAGGPPRARLADEPVAVELQALAEQLGVGNRLRLLGAVPQDRMPALYRSADVVACVPAYEPFGITPLEAMACGTPVVAYAVGGLRDSVQHNVTGMLVPPGDEGRLADTLRRLLADDQTRHLYARAAVRRVRERYRWEAIAEQLEFTYRAAIAQRHAPHFAAAASW